jgi:hypothetical protein
MPNTTRVFRDTLSIDQNLFNTLNPNLHPGDTLVLGGRQVSLVALLPAYNYVIAADQLTVAPQAVTSITGTGENPSPAVTVLAGAISGLLSITCAGAPGKTGAAGKPGADRGTGGGGTIDGGNQFPQRPIKPGGLPGGNGGQGGIGGTGHTGGNVTIHFVSATPTPQANALGGVGGKGGPGGRGGGGDPPGEDGEEGETGRPGRPGKTEIAQVGASDIWKALDGASVEAWAAYRAEVAGYLFRKFDPDSQIAAFEEAGAALFLNPGDPDAAAVRSRIANRQIPSGLSRDLDIAPDFQALAANLTSEIDVVHGAFQIYANVVSLDAIADSIRDNLSAMALQLSDRKAEAQADVGLAMQDVRIAQAEQSNIQAQIDDLQDQINAVRDKSFSLAGTLSDVGSIAGVIAGMATGVGAIMSIKAGLATLQRVADGRDLKQLLDELGKQAKDPTRKVSEEDTETIKKLGGGAADLIKGTNSMISFTNVISDLDNAMELSEQNETGKLLKQQAEFVRQKMVASLRVAQAQSRVSAVQSRVGNLATEIQDVQQRIDHWSTDHLLLAAATDLLIGSARRVVDMVMEDVFLAQRAREIYQLETVPNLRFDFGYLPPDQDHSLEPAIRATASLVSLSSFAIEVLAWNNIFQRLNTAEIGFDVIHPQLSVAITDPARLDAFASGAALDFSISLADLPRGMFELKVGALGLELVGGSSEQSTNIWITHSGDWDIIRRTDGSVASLHLLPRSELFACSPATGNLTASIPAHSQSSSNGGPPFSFWGRGVATTFRLQMAQPSVSDLSRLSAIHLTLDCIGYAPQGSGGAVSLKALRPVARITHAAPAPVQA